MARQKVARRFAQRDTARLSTEALAGALRPRVVGYRFGIIARQSEPDRFELRRVAELIEKIAAAVLRKHDRAASVGDRRALLARQRVMSDDFAARLQPRRARGSGRCGSARPDAKACIPPANRMHSRRSGRKRAPRRRRLRPESDESCTLEPERAARSPR